jgi:hypothetical protein
MKIHHILAVLLALVLATSCSDLLNDDSDRVIVNPSLDQKTDSIFYMLGILKGMQQAGDLYVLTNEMRGDLATTNANTETTLRQLAHLTAGKDNPYDSAYVYYRIINNCNYYIAHRDTTLHTGDRAVTLPEYAEAKAIRAWTYIQLANTFGPAVPFTTSPVTNLEQVNAVSQLPKFTAQQIAEALIPDLLPYAGYAVPNYGTINAGRTNSGKSKTVVSTQTMIPVDVMLGDLYLIDNQYENAAKAYFRYLATNGLATTSYSAYSASSVEDHAIQLPNDFRATGGTTWQSIFYINNPRDIVTMVPMAVNRLQGTISNLPKYFGYDFYSTASTDTSLIVSALFTKNREVEPSKSYQRLVAAQDYYYVPSTSADDHVVRAAQIGDMRYCQQMASFTDKGAGYYVNIKYSGANIPLYRVSSVWLRFAEAVNRMGYPDLAFAVLKDGISRNLLTSDYLSSESQKLIESGSLPFLSSLYSGKFATANGIHHHGSGLTEGLYSPYRYSDIVGEKMADMAKTYGITVGQTKNDTINAVEDLICDEMALETSMEGSRFTDLLRFWSHKQSDNTYMSDWGTAWLNRKLSLAKGFEVDESKWYMPFN